MLVAIWAQDKNGLIGKENHLPWHLPADLRFFKEQTLHHTLVMGRKTFEGMGGRPLPKRQTIVLTRDENYQAEGILIMHSVDEVLAYDEAHQGITYIAGGSAVYQELLPYCQKIYRTVIDHGFSGDAYFPAIQWDNWQLAEKIEYQQDDENPYDYQIETYLRKINRK